MPPPRPKGVGYTTGATSSRPNSNTPMSERQQMALLIQMTATSSTDVSRTHQKKNEYKKGDADVDDSDSNEKPPDTSEIRDKIVIDEVSTENKKEFSADQSVNQIGGTSGKRNYSDGDEDEYDEADDAKKKKRKDTENVKDIKCTSNMKITSRFDKNVKQTQNAKTNTPSANKINLNVSDKEQVEQSKMTDIENENEAVDDFRCNDSLFNGSLKVPPLKIVIPQQNCSIDTEGNVLRTGKVTTSRNAALPYVVSTSSESTEKELSAQSSSPNESPLKSSTTSVSAIDDRSIKLINEEKTLRVLRSSHRSGISNVERGSNNSSPQMQSSSPSPASCSNTNEAAEVKVTFTNIASSPMQANQVFDQENIVNLPSPSTSSTSSSKDINTSLNVELHPRKRKIRSKNETESCAKSANVASNSNTDLTNVTGDAHPHDFPFTNGFQMYLNIRRQIEKKWKNLYPVKPRPPQSYNEYLLTKRSYLLSVNEDKPNLNIPNGISEQMEGIYIEQEKERHQLAQRHIVEREKLCLNVEQEIIRVHSKAARNMSYQSAPYSVCTFLKDDEVYNMLTPEQDEKDKNARCRFNGRLLLSWLQDVDDKWEKIKESMLLRHHNEAESLHAVQLMNWDMALKKKNLCDYDFEPTMDKKDHVPIVYVSDDFDLLPA